MRDLLAVLSGSGRTQTSCARKQADGAPGDEREGDEQEVVLSVAAILRLMV